MTDLLAVTGYFSAKNVEICAEGVVQTLLAMARDSHHPDWADDLINPIENKPSFL